MGDIKILGSLDGDILASGKIKRLFVGQSIAGNVSSRSGKGNAVGELIIGGDIAEGGLNIQGNMGRIVIAGNLGHTGSDFTVTGKLGSLTVKGDLYSNIHVGTTLGKLNVGGSIISGVLVERADQEHHRRPGRPARRDLPLQKAAQDQDRRPDARPG